MCPPSRGMGDAMDPSGDDVLGHIEVSDTERIAAPRDSSRSALPSYLSACYYSGVIATVTTTAMHCGQEICIYSDHPHRSGISALWWIAGAVALLMVLVWLRRRGSGDAL